MDRKIIYLWDGTAPYSETSGGQAQPSITDFSVEGSKGAVIVAPGGGYVMKAPHEGNPIAEMINEAGVSAFVLDYRVMPCEIFAPLGDIKRAIRLVRSMGYEKVAILGFSAGGHLICSAATLYDEGDKDSEDPIERISSRPDAFVPCYGVVSFSQFTHQGSVQSLLGDKATDYKFLRKLSAELQVTEDTPEAFIWHTASDELVPVENSLKLALSLTSHGVNYEMHIFPEGRHGLGLAQEYSDVSQWTTLFKNWLIKRNYN